MDSASENESDSLAGKNKSGSGSNSPATLPHTSLSLDDCRIAYKLKSESDADNYAIISNSTPKMEKSLRIRSEEDGVNRTLSSKETAKADRRRKILTLVVYGTAEFFAAVVISLQQPFYPAEAEKKGVTASQYGAVFGIFELTVFISSFFYGKYMSAIGPRFAFIVGLLVTGVCSILFGFLDKVEDGQTFFILSIIIRIVEACGDAAFVNAAFVIIAMEFTDSLATVFGAMETITGTGFIVGPILGGALFQLGGFSFPFWSTGTFSILTAVFTFFVMPLPRGSNDSIKETKQKGMLRLLRVPEVVISVLTILFGAISLGYLSATLEPHLRPFGLSPVTIGLVIVVTAVVYAVTAPFWGWMCDRMANLEVFMLIGSIFIVLGYLLIGPAPFLPFNTILWVTCVGLGLQGLGLGALFVSAALRPLKSANELGFPDTVGTYSLVSNLWTSFFSLGNFIGPTVSGILYDAVGFRNGTMFVVGTQLFIILAIIFVLIFRANKNGKYKKNLEEMDPLLGTSKTYGSNTKHIS